VTPGACGLHQNYPNPFNPWTTISFELPIASVVTLKVFDIVGREVATLLHGTRQPGKHIVVFDAQKFGKLSSGVFLYRLTAGDFTASRAMLMLK